MKRFAFFVAAFLLTFGLSSLATPAVQAQSFATWSAAYYNNLFLRDPSAVNRTESEINFDWGTGSPAPGIHPDTFSARFGADVYFAAGTYRFTLQADDSARLSIDGTSYMNTLDAPQPGTVQSVDVTLTAGTHHLQVDYQERTGNALLKLAWVNTANIPITNPTGNWQAQYFRDTSLTGTPVVTITEATPSHNWSINAPYPGVPADNFSVRWSQTLNLPAGDYQIKVAADDGVRVFVDGVARINEWHLATGQTYSTTVNLSAGTHNFVVEYYEAGFAAFIDYSFTALNQQNNPNPPTGATATVTAGVLNVRNVPNAITGVVLTKIRQGQTFDVTGRNGDSTWWRLNVNGVVGWVSGQWVRVTNAGVVPVVDESSTGNPPTTNIIVTAAVNLNVRSGPGVNFTQLSRIPLGGSAQVVGRNSSNSWLQVLYNGVTGWVSAVYVVSATPITYSQIPITG